MPHGASARPAAAGAAGARATRAGNSMARRSGSGGPEVDLKNLWHRIFYHHGQVNQWIDGYLMAI